MMLSAREAPLLRGRLQRRPLPATHRPSLDGGPSTPAGRPRPGPGVLTLAPVGTGGTPRGDAAQGPRQGTRLPVRRSFVEGRRGPRLRIGWDTPAVVARDRRRYRWFEAAQMRSRPYCPSEMGRTL